MEYSQRDLRLLKQRNDLIRHRMSLDKQLDKRERARLKKIINSIKVMEYASDK